MKNYLLLPLLALAPLFLHGQSGPAEQKSPFSFYGSLVVQGADFSVLNQQLAQYNVPALESAVGGLAAGLQIRIPQTAFSTGLEAYFLEACPDHADDASETMALVTGYGFKVRQSYHAYLHNGWSLVPAVGLGYQRACLKVDGELYQDASLRIVPFENKICSGAVYADYGLGVEKEMPLHGRAKSVYLAAALSYRQPFERTTQTTVDENAFVDWSADLLGGVLLELTFRADMF